MSNSVAKWVSSSPTGAARKADVVTTSPEIGPSSARAEQTRALMMQLEAVKRARSRYQASRRPSASVTSRAERPEQVALLAEAMATYAEAATALGIPLPYRYRSELRLYQAMVRAGS